MHARYLLVQVRDGMRVIVGVSGPATLLFGLALRTAGPAPRHQAKHMHYTALANGIHRNQHIQVEQKFYH